jgi:hypothetical protein
MRCASSGLHVKMLNFMPCEVYLNNGSYLPQRRKGRKEIQMLMMIKTITNTVKDFVKVTV